MKKPKGDSNGEGVGLVECPYCHKEFSLLLKCKRCNHEWRPRFDEEPEICPKCKSPYWKKPRKNKKRRNK